MTGEWRNPAIEAQKKQVLSGSLSRIEKEGGGQLRDTLTGQFLAALSGLEDTFSGPSDAFHDLQWPSGPGQQARFLPSVLSTPLHSTFNEVESPSAGRSESSSPSILSEDWRFWFLTLDH
jgi:hypothetical protein